MGKFKFQVGDTVYVVNDHMALDKIGGEYSLLHVPEMNMFCGKTAVVLKNSYYRRDDGVLNVYLLQCNEGNFGEWWFHEEHLSPTDDGDSFAPVPEEAITKLLFC